MYVGQQLVTTSIGKKIRKKYINIKCVRELGSLKCASCSNLVWKISENFHTIFFKGFPNRASASDLTHILQTLLYMAYFDHFILENFSILLRVEHHSFQFIHTNIAFINIDSKSLCHFPHQ